MQGYSLVHKQSFLNLLRQNDRRVTKVYLPEKNYIDYLKRKQTCPYLDWLLARIPVFRVDPVCQVFPDWESPQ